MESTAGRMWSPTTTMLGRLVAQVVVSSGLSPARNQLAHPKSIPRQEVRAVVGHQPGFLLANARHFVSWVTKASALAILAEATCRRSAACWRFRFTSSRSVRNAIVTW